MKFFTFLLLAFVAVFGTACSTVESRIEDNPGLFEALPQGEREFVLQGRITEGMTHNAVFLAWGRPDETVRGSQNGKAFEAWTYLASRSQIVGGYGVGVGAGVTRRGTFLYQVPVYETVVIRQDFPIRSVQFERGRVTAWSDATLR